MLFELGVSCRFCIVYSVVADCMPSFYPIMVEGYAALFSCTTVVQASDSMTLEIVG